MLLPLLEPLYVALAAGNDAATALALAQRACLASADTQLASPLVWASLSALGAGRRASADGARRAEQA
jgi:hypothetical protein